MVQRKHAFPVTSAVVFLFCPHSSGSVLFVSPLPPLSPVVVTLPHTVLRFHPRAKTVESCTFAEIRRITESSRLGKISKII